MSEKRDNGLWLDVMTGERLGRIRKGHEGEYDRENTKDAIKRTWSTFNIVHALHERYESKI